MNGKATARYRRNVCAFLQTALIPIASSILRVSFANFQLYCTVSSSPCTRIHIDGDCLSRITNSQRACKRKQHNRRDIGERGGRTNDDSVSITGCSLFCDIPLKLMRLSYFESNYLILLPGEWLRQDERGRSKMANVIRLTSGKLKLKFKHAKLMR